MKQKMKRFMAGFLSLLTVFTTLFGNGATAFAASSKANISFWYASTRAFAGFVLAAVAAGLAILFWKKRKDGNGAEA